MEKVILTLSLVLLSLSIFAQKQTAQKQEVKFYNSASDFKKGIVAKTYTGYGINYSFKLGKSQISIDDTKIKLDDVKYWGFSQGTEGLKSVNVYRIDKKKEPYLVISSDDKLVIYTEYMSRYSSESGELTFSPNQFKPKVSLGLQGEMLELDKNNLKQLVKGNTKALEELKKREKGNYQSLFDFVSRYNKGINSVSFIEETARFDVSHTYTRTTNAVTQMPTKQLNSSTVTAITVSLNEYEKGYVVLTNGDTIHGEVKKAYYIRNCFGTGYYRTESNKVPKQFDNKSVKAYMVGEIPEEHRKHFKESFFNSYWAMRQLYVAKTHGKKTSYMRFLTTVNGVNIYLTYGNRPGNTKGRLKTRAGFKFAITLPEQPIVLEKDNKLDMLTSKELKKAKMISGIGWQTTMAYERLISKLKVGGCSREELEKIVSLHESK